MWQVGEVAKLVLQFLGHFWFLIWLLDRVYLLLLPSFPNFQNHSFDPRLIFPSLIWDTFPKAGASQVDN